MTHAKRACANLKMNHNPLPVQHAKVTAADAFGNFYIVPDRSLIGPASLNERGGVTIDAAANDFNPEVIKARTCFLSVGAALHCPTVQWRRCR
jgi:hypothetical protein